jgi:glucokinase
MYLGIEIGGTKLQLGVAAGDGSAFVAFERLAVQPDLGADGILKQIKHVGQQMIEQHSVRGVGFGFGGPIDAVEGRVITSHQIQGWSDFPLSAWCEETLQRPVVLGNDCDCAAIAEAKFGAGKNLETVLYVTVGTGIGGGLVTDGRLVGLTRPAIAEIGHLRPGLPAENANQTVESISSGQGIETEARLRLGDESISSPTQDDSNTIDADDSDRLDLMTRCGGDLSSLTAKTVAEAANDGNGIALDIFQRAIQTLGWAIAQSITLVAPNVVIVGGGVSLAGDGLFYRPLRDQVARYVFPPLQESFAIVAPTLGEDVVVHGAVLRAKENQ